MDIDAKKVNYANVEDVPAKGDEIFRDPYLYHVLDSSPPQGWALMVDKVEYVRAVQETRGKSEEEALEIARQAYVAGLAAFEVDDFEADMFWQAYQEVASVASDPYAGSDAREGQWERNVG